MSYREVEDVVDFGDDELNMARNVVEQAQATRQEDDSMKDRSLAEYREEANYESDSQDGSSQDEGSYPDYDADPQATGIEPPSSNLSNLGDAFYPEDSEEEGDYESDSQDTSVRYPPSDASGSDQDMLASSEYFGSRENADIDNELYELARPPSPMSTDAGSESGKGSRVPSPMNTDVEAGDTEMSETAVGQPAASFHSEMSEIYTHPDTSVNLSETAVQPVPPVNLKSEISLFVNLPLSPPQAAYTTPATPKFVIDFGVDTSNLAPLKPDTDMSEAPLQTAPPEAQDTKELQSELEPALQSTTDEIEITDPVQKINQDTPADVSDVKIEPASVETSMAPSSSSKSNSNTKMSPTVEEHQPSAPTKEAVSSEKDERIEEQPSPGDKPSRPNYKDVGTQTNRMWAVTDTIQQLQSRLKKLGDSFIAWRARFEASNARLEKLIEEGVAEAAKMRIVMEKRQAERARRNAEFDKRQAEWDKRRAEQDARHLKLEQDRLASDEAYNVRSLAYLAKLVAFNDKLDNYKPPDYLSERIRKMMAAPAGRSPEDQRIVEEAEAAVAGWNARYEALQANVKALGEKIANIKLE